MLDPETLSPAKSLSSYLETFSLFPAHALSTKAAMAQVSLSRSAMLTRPASRTVRIGSARRGQRARRAGEGTDGSRLSFFSVSDQRLKLSRAAAPSSKPPFANVRYCAGSSIFSQNEGAKKAPEAPFFRGQRATDEPSSRARQALRESSLSLSLSTPPRFFPHPFLQKKHPPPFPPSTTPPRPAPPAPPP